MKLRIKGSSIRLRLTKTEIAQIKQGQKVEEVLSFGGASQLTYSLEPSADVSTLTARLDGLAVRVLAPFAMAREWASSEEVALKNQHATPLILVEKDFFCLKPRVHEVEDESDMFDNPNKNHGSCG